jgi:hypothetical protein
MLGLEMSEQQPMEQNPPSPQQSAGDKRHRPRRGRRGGQGRGRGRRTRPAAPVVVSAERTEEIAAPVGEITAPAQEAPVTSETFVEPAPQETSRPKSRFDGIAIAKALTEVRQIVDSLEQALEQMDEVLELVEQAEHQKVADEHEIAALRRALHKLQPPHREQPEHREHKEHRDHRKLDEQSG